MKKPPYFTILCIPGSWKDLDAFTRAAAEQQVYRMPDHLLCQDRRWRFELQAAEPRMVQAFQASGSARFPGLDEAVAAHRSVLYLHVPGGRVESLTPLTDLVPRLLRAGGLGVKVETGGVATAPTMWLELPEHHPSQHPVDLLRLMVLPTRDDVDLRTSGMQNFGLPDPVARLDLASPRELMRDAARLAQELLLSGVPREQTWQGSRQRWHLKRETVVVDPANPLHNPWGQLRLSAAP